MFPTVSGPKWTSPLKPQNPNPLPPHAGDRIRKRLFAEHADESENIPPSPDVLDRSTVLALYSISTHSVAEHSSMVDMLLHLEKMIRSNNQITEPEEIRTGVRRILRNECYEMQMAEVGMMLFYLDRDGTLPHAHSLVDYRAQQIAQHIRSYIDAHLQAGAPTLIPSGKTHYLLRAFAHMVLTSDQTFNLGGVHAIHSLLTNPRYSLSNYLRAEHREHILIVVRQILASPAFCTLFQKEIVVHPEMQEILRLDLKLPPDHPVTSVYALYGCLMALFSDLRQLDSPNCYAVSASIYASEIYTYKFLSHLVQWIQDGHYLFENTIPIPLRPRLESRVTFNQDLSIPVQESKIASLPFVEHIFSTLSIDSPPATPTRTSPLGQSLARLLGPHKTHLPYVKQLVHTYKINLLAQLPIKVLEFANANHARPGERTLQPSIYSTDKNWLINHCLIPIEAWCNGKNIPKDAIDRLRSKLEKCLWLEYTTEMDVSIERGVIHCGSERIPNFTGDRSALADLIGTSQRAFWCENGTYEPLLTISSLQNAIAKAAHSIAENDLVGTTLARGARSDLFRDRISIQASSQIDTMGIAARHLSKADLLIFKNLGGWEDAVLQIVFDITFRSTEMTDCRTPYRLLEQLVHLLTHQVDTAHLNRVPKMLIMTPNGHTWTLTPSCWQLLLDNQGEFSSFVQHNLFDPAQRRLQTIAPQYIIERVIERFAKSADSQARMSEALLNHSLTFGELRGMLLDRVHPARFSEMEEIIEEEFWKITPSLSGLRALLKHLHLSVPQQSFYELFDLIGSAPALPHQVALKVRAALIDLHLAIIDPYEIELALCKAYDLPMPLGMGDLNWSVKRSEDPEHKTLMILYSWVRSTLAYFVRGAESQHIKPNASFDRLTLLLPKALMK